MVETERAEPNFYFFDAIIRVLVIKIMRVIESSLCCDNSLDPVDVVENVCVASV